MSTPDILDFGARPDNAPVAADLGAGAQPAPASETVLAVDRWGKRRAADIVERWAEQGVEPADLDVVADAHESLFSPSPEAAAQPADASRAAWWAQMMATPEYAALHNQTMLSPELSELAAAQICREWGEYADAQPEPRDGDGDGAPAPGSDDEAIGKTIQRMRSTSRALAQAREDVDTAQATAAGLGTGDGQQLDPATMRAMFARVRNDRTLRAIMEMAGRATRLAKSLQRIKLTAPRGEITGLEPGGDVARLLPLERAILSDAAGRDLGLLAAYRVATRRALCYRMRRSEPQGRGPVVVSVDESGSMSGDRIVAAKGLALAMAWLAHHQRRWVCLAGWSDQAAGECTRYLAEPGRSDPAALLDWCAHMYNGGTSLDGPLATVPGWWPQINPPKGRVDHIIISDGECDLPDSLRDSYRAWAKDEGVRTYAIMVDTRSAGGLAEVADRVWCLPSLDLDSAAISAVLSI